MDFHLLLLNFAGFGVIALGLGILLWSAEKFVESSALLAQDFRVSPFLISMIVIGFGTSAPEMIVSTLATFQGNAGVAVGNAYGSNIANIALVLGATIAIAPLHIDIKENKFELGALCLATALTVWLGWNGQIDFVEAMAFLILFAGIMVVSFFARRRGASTSASLAPLVAKPGESFTVRRNLLFVFIGLLGLLGGSYTLVESTVFLARLWGVSDLVLGLTVVAIGTSLPELAASIAAAYKGRHEMVLGNVIGSNLFNTLAVIGLSGLVAPLPITEGTLVRDFPFMAGLTGALFALHWCGLAGSRSPKRRLPRYVGFALLASYLIYMFLVTTTERL